MTIETIARAKRIYLDSNICIYFVEGTPDRQSASRRVFELAEQANVPLITSELALAECLFGAYKQGNEALASHYRDILQDSAAITLIPIDTALLDLAAQIGPQSGLKLVDAIHAATALGTGCDVFVTNDVRIRSLKDLEVVQLVE